MIAEIIPYTKLPRNLDVFDYIIDDDLCKNCKVGEVLYIPWRRQKIIGVIKSLKKESEFQKLKTISEKTGLILSEKNLKLLLTLSDYYINSPSLFLKELLPEIPQKKHEVKLTWTDIYNWQYDEKIAYDLPNINALKKEISAEYKRHLILSNQEKRRLALYWNYLINYKQKGTKQLMIIFPNIQDIEEFLKIIPENYKEEISIISNKIYQKKTLYFNEWKKIQNNQVKIILGTRSALFCPLDNVETLIIDKAESRDYKQEEPNPRYHATDLAYLSQKIYNFRLILSSLSPRFLDYFLSKEKANFQIINDYQNIKNTVQWINMKNEIYDEARHPVFSEKAEEIIKKNKSENILILHNKKGQSNEVRCKKCHQILICPSCLKPYNYDNKEQTLYCNDCKNKQKYKQCSNCQSTELYPSSYGIKDLQKYWQSKGIGSVAIEQENYSRDKEIDLFKKDQKGQIIIATNYIFSLLPLNYFDKIIITNTDRLLYSNDFNANWHSFNEYNELIHKAAENNVELYLQTYNFDHFLFQSLKNQKLNSFYQAEIKWRQALAYPPFKQLIKLIYQNENINEGEKIVKNFYQKLKNEIKENLKISLPYPIYKVAVQRKNKKTYRWIIAIRCNYNEIKPGTVFYNLLKNLDTDWLIDINPENLYK